jgi:hypothetical protein
MLAAAMDWDIIDARSKKKTARYISLCAAVHAAVDLY